MDASVNIDLPAITDEREEDGFGDEEEDEEPLRCPTGPFQKSQCRRETWMFDRQENGQEETGREFNLD